MAIESSGLATMATGSRVVWLCTLHRETARDGVCSVWDCDVANGMGRGEVTGICAEAPQGQQAPRVACATEGLCGYAGDARILGK